MFYWEPYPLPDLNGSWSDNNSTVLLRFKTAIQQSKQVYNIPCDQPLDYVFWVQIQSCTQRNYKHDSKIGSLVAANMVS